MSVNPVVTIITPAYNEAKNLPLLCERLKTVMADLKISWEWFIMDDHSSDGTYQVITDLKKTTPEIKGVRFSRNFGSHPACFCALQNAKGQCAIVIAADLQDPPEAIAELLKVWKEGSQVVWAVRRSRPGEKTANVGFSKLYYFMMRKFVGIKEMPPNGADFFLLDQVVVRAIQAFREGNVNIMALITWMGFKQGQILYDKRVREHGKSGWNFERKLKLVVDSVTSFTYLPLRLMIYVGGIVAVSGFIYAGFALENAFRGNPPPGWTSLTIFVLVIGGIQMLMMGTLGEYLWRALDESRRRPRYLIESTTLGDVQEIK